MTDNQSAAHLVATATVTPAMREARRALLLAGIIALAFAAWLTLGLMFCSVNLELSTQSDHTLGSVTHVVCSWLLKSIGVMSFSLALLMVQLGRLLCTSRIPQVSLSDITLYLTLICLSASQLQLALQTEMFGAPIGGLVGVTIGALLLPLGPVFAQLLDCLAIFLLCFVHLRLAPQWLERSSTSASNRDSEGSKRSERSESVYLNAHPVKSLNHHQQRAHTHVIEQVGIQPPEFEEESKRFEAVESFYDDLSARNAPADVNDVEQLLNFNFESRDYAEPRLTREQQAHQNLATASRTGDELSQTERSQSRRSHSSGPLPSEETNPLEHSGGRSRSSRSASRRNERSSTGTQSKHAQSGLIQNVSTGVHLHRESTSSYTGSQPERSPIEQLSQEISPRISREMILMRAFSAQNIQVQLVESQSGVAMDRYTLITAQVPYRPIHEITESLNLHIRRSLGRTEPPAFLTLTRDTRITLDVSWPKRGYSAVKSKAAITTIRELKRSHELSLYLGEAANGERALLPFKESLVTLITGGAEVNRDSGLNLLVLNLIYQIPAQRLRILMVDRDCQHSPIATLNHLYSPIISEHEDISDLFTWLTAEQRRRRGMLARFNVESFDDLQRAQLRSGEGDASCDVRLVCVISDLSQLSERQHLLMSNLIEKLTQTKYAHVGIHLIINSRGPLIDVLRQARDSIDAQLSLPARDLDESNLICSPGSEWLTANHDILFSFRGDVARVNTWDLSTESYLGILTVFTQQDKIGYIKPDTNFERVVPLSSMTGKIPKVRESVESRVKGGANGAGAAHGARGEARAHSRGASALT